MQVEVFGRNVDVTPALKTYASKRLKKLERMLHRGRELRAQVALEVKRDRHAVEVTVPLNGLILRAEAASESMYASIDQVLDKLVKQVTRYKDRLVDKRRSGEAGPDLPPAPAQPEPQEIVKVKRFALKPQTVSEAIMQLDLLGHDFYVFHNADSEEIGVVYRRKEGGYGLIQPLR